MQKWLLVLLLLTASVADAQRGMIFVKKNGIKKVATFAEGATIKFHKSNGDIIHGIIALVKNDSVYINGMAHPASSIKRIILREKNKKLQKEILLTSAGIVAASALFSLSREETFASALARFSVIGYGNILIRSIPKIKRKQYRVGRKFSLQALDLHF